jgi:hypothetical protein
MLQMTTTAILLSSTTEFCKKLHIPELLLPVLERWYVSRA